MLLVVIGRKTGRQFEIPVSFAKLDGVYVALTLKANQWWRNLKVGTCTAVIRGERVACTIDIIDDDVVSSIEQNLRALIAHNPLDALAGVRLNWRLKPNEKDLKDSGRATRGAEASGVQPQRIPLQAADRVPPRQPIEAPIAHQNASAVGRLASIEPRGRRL